MAESLGVEEGDILELEIVSGRAVLKPVPDPFTLALRGRKFARTTVEELDTTYILPSLGVEVNVERAVFERLRELLRERKIECFYTPFNILEALWKIAKTSYDRETLLTGLESIEKWFELVTPGAEDYAKAIELMGNFPDLIDLILYSTARNRGLKFLTRDSNLVAHQSREGGRGRDNGSKRTCYRCDKRCDKNKVKAF